MTSMTRAAREDRIAAALQALLGLSGQHERTELPWQGSRVILDVVRLPVEVPLLNPTSHRIKAELESSPRRDVVSRDPFSEAAQEELTRLLQGTADYSALREDVKENGQLDFGVITRAGVLVNANTRLVALRDLRHSHIKVAVLPADADEQSIEELEAYLQLRVERKQPYSFPNELLFVEDMRRRGKSEEELAVQLGWAESKEPAQLRKGRERVQQYIRMLAIVREVVRSSSGAIPITFFDGRRQALIEIDDQYEQLKARDPRNALRVRSARLLGLVASVGYRELRDVDETFLASYLPAGLSENNAAAFLAAEAEVSATMPDADNVLSLFEEGAIGGVSTALDVSPLLDRLLTTHGADTVTLPGIAEPANREHVLNAVRNAYESATEDYQADKEARGQVDAPKKLLSEAVKKVNKASTIVTSVHTEPNFNIQEVRDQLLVLGRSIEALRRQLDAE